MNAVASHPREVQQLWRRQNSAPDVQRVDPDAYQDLNGDRQLESRWDVSAFHPEFPSGHTERIRNVGHCESPFWRGVFPSFLPRTEAVTAIESSSSKRVMILVRATPNSRNRRSQGARFLAYQRTTFRSERARQKGHARRRAKPLHGGFG